MDYNFIARDVLNEVVRLSKEDPDFVYTDQPGREIDDPCGYAGLAPGTTEGRSCIVGQALQNLGVPADDICQLSTKASAVVEHLLHVKDDDSTELLNRLDWVQFNQDSGLSWGESVSKALSARKDYA